MEPVVLQQITKEHVIALARRVGSMDANERKLGKRAMKCLWQAQEKIPTLPPGSRILYLQEEGTDKISVGYITPNRPTI